MRKPTTDLVSAGADLAPAAFGTVSDDLLAGTFGDRRISAFRSATGGVPRPTARLERPPGHHHGRWGWPSATAAWPVTPPRCCSPSLNDEADGPLGTLQPAEHAGAWWVGMQLHRPRTRVRAYPG